MKLKKHWKAPIVLLEKTIEDMEHKYNISNTAGLTASQMQEHKQKYLKSVAPFKELLITAKSKGYVLTDDERRQNMIYPFFR